MNLAPGALQPTFEAPGALELRFGPLLVKVVEPAGPRLRRALPWVGRGHEALPPGAIELDVALAYAARASCEVGFARLDADGFLAHTERATADVVWGERRGRFTVCSERTQHFECFNGLVEAALVTGQAAVLAAGGLSLHAAAVVLDGEAFVVMGRSGAGKSTWQKRFREGRLHDDHVLVAPGERGWTVWRHAEWRGFRGPGPWQPRLGGLFVLGPDRDRTAVEALSPTDAVAAIVANLSHLGGASAAWSLRNAVALAAAVPPHLLSHSLGDPPERVAEILRAVRRSS